MKISKSMSINRFMALVVAGTLAATPVFADKPDNAGKGKSHHDRDNRGGKHRDRDDHNKGGKHDDRDDRAQGSRKHFGDRQQVIARDYFAQEYRSGRCPPGLAKKNNGCMPPGQAKKWKKGRSLPRDVVYYDVPQQLVVRLGPPPSGHKYVRVASYILLIAIGTSMVVDAITDLGRM